METTGWLSSKIQSALPAIFVCIGFYLGAKLGLSLSMPPNDIAAFWPPNPVVLATFLISKQRWWILILAMTPAYLYAALESGVSTHRIIIFYIANCTEILLAAFSIKYFLTKQLIKFDHFNEIIIFLLSAVLISPVISAFIASLTIFYEEGVSYWIGWRFWFLSDALGHLTLTPVFILWFTYLSSERPSLRTISLCRLTELIFFILCLFSVSFISLGGDIGSSHILPALLYSPLPVLLWAAIRFGPLAVYSALFVITILAIWNAVNGQGPFTNFSAAENVFSLQLFMLVISVPMMLLSALLSERKQAEEALQKSEEHLRQSQLYGNIGTWEADFLTNKEIWSEAVSSTLGFPKVAEPTWNLFLETIHPDDRDHVLTIINGHLNEGKECDVEYRIIDTQGEIRWMRSTGKGEFDSNGKPLKLRGTVQEITKLKQAENEISIRTEELTKAVQIKSDFLSNMSHEIRTPMNAIIGMTHLTLLTDLNAQQKNYLSKIDTSSKWLMCILNDILDFSKLESGKIKLEHIVFKLDSIISYLRDVTSSSIYDKQLELKFEIDDNVSQTLVGDPLRLGQVLLNLLNNAIKFTESGTITISVQVIRSNATNQELDFRVVDMGIGLSSEQQVNLFSAFDQADNSTTRLYGGTGLGLAISKQLVEAMGGTIGIKSRLGFGSTFYFKLSLGVQAVNEAGHPPTNPIITSANYSELNNAHLLLVEDNLLNQELLLEMLTTRGIQLDIANNGAEAVMMIKNNNYSAVLMDCQMPVMDGFEATRNIREIPRYADLPIIAMTANVMKEDKERCLASGMNSHLAKPIELDKLLQTLTHWIKPTNLPNVPISIPTTKTNQQDWVAFSEKISGFDLKNLMLSLRGDQNKALHLLDLFRKQLILEYPNILDNITAGKLTEAQIGLHKLQGSIISLGATNFSHACAKLEEDLKNKSYNALILTQWRETYNKTLDSLSSLLDKSSVTAISDRLEFLTDMRALLVADCFINDQQLAQFKTHALENQQLEYMHLIQSIIEVDYPKALSILNELIQKENKTLTNKNPEFTSSSVKTSQVQQPK